MDTGDDHGGPIGPLIRDFIEVHQTAEHEPLPPLTGFREAMVLTEVLTDGASSAALSACRL